MARFTITRLGGGLLLIAIGLIALSYPFPFLALVADGFQYQPLTFSRPVDLLLSAALLAGLAALTAAQRERLGRVSGVIALAGLLLGEALLLPSAYTISALSAALMGSGLLAPLMPAPVGVSVVTVMLGWLAALLFSAGLVGCGLAAQRAGRPQWWWAPLILGAWSIVSSATQAGMRQATASGGLYAPLMTLGIVLTVAVPLALWALLGVGLLIAREDEEGEEDAWEGEWQGQTPPGQ